MRSSFVLGIPFSSIASAIAGVLYWATSGNTPVSLCGSALIELIIGVCLTTLIAISSAVGFALSRQIGLSVTAWMFSTKPNEIVWFALRRRSCVGIKPVGAGLCLAARQILNELRIALHNSLLHPFAGSVDLFSDYFQMRCSFRGYLLPVSVQKE